MSASRDGPASIDGPVSGSGDGNACPTSGPRPALNVATRASLARRLGALLYEALLLIAMAFIAGFAFLPLLSPPGADRTALTIPPLLARTVLFGALVGGAAWYYTWSWSNGRRTLPQKTWRLQLVDVHGHALARRTALARYAAGWIGPALALIAYAALRPAPAARLAAGLLFFNYAWSIFDRDRLFLHDRIAGTSVVRD